MRAVRRYWWAALVVLVICTLVGAVALPVGAQQFQTEAWVQVLPDVGGTSADRQVQNQLVLLDSVAMAQAVADEIGGTSATAVRQAVTFEQVSGSDVIRIVAESSNPERAQAIANGYIDAYLGALRTQVEGLQETDITALDDSLRELEESLNDVDARITQALSPFVGTGSSDGPAVIPTIDQVAPALATEREVILSEYNDLLQRRTELQLASLSSELPSQATQLAVLPEEPIGSQLPLGLLAGALVGLVLAVLVPVVLARTSTKVLDLDEASQVLEAPIAGVLGRLTAPMGPMELLEEPLPERVAAAVQALAVRAEANSVDDSLVMAVAGSSRSVGTTTLAVLLARHLASQGASVLLLDADTSNPTLSEEYSEVDSGLLRLLATSESETVSAGARRGASGEPTRATVIPNLRFAGVGKARELTVLRRQDVPTLLAAARCRAQVVVIDAGPLMETASAVQVAHLADAVVLGFSARHQPAKGLSVVARQLRGARGVLLPVATPTKPN